MKVKIKTSIFLLIVLLSIPVCFLSTQRLLKKADIPYSSLQTGTVIFSVNGFPAESESRLEYLLDSKNIGDTVYCELSNNGINSKEALVLVPYYDGYLFIIVSLLIAFTFLVTASFVVIKKPDDRYTNILFRVLLLFALATITSPGKYSFAHDYIAIIIRVIHATSYLLGIAAFLHLSYVFPKDLRKSNLLISVTYIFYGSLSVIISNFIIKSLQEINSPSINILETLWLIIRIALLFSILSGTLIFFFKSRKLTSLPEKKKIHWILWGISAGVIPYLILFVLPEIFDLKLLIPEEYSLLPMVLIPVSFAIAVVRYRVFDIELLINKSIVYSILTAFVIISYLSVVLVSASLMPADINRIILMIAVFIIAFIFSPLRNKIQNLVDRTFYRERYSFREAIDSFTKKISDCPALSRLGLIVMNEILELIPAGKFVFVLSVEDGARLKILSQKNSEDIVNSIRAFRIKMLVSPMNKPFAVPGKVEHGIDIDSSLANVFNKWELDIAFPLKLESDIALGAIVMGNKLSGKRFSQNDINLLNVIASESSVAVKRLQLQEEIILKELEKQKLEELSSLKSFFAASVSHDLKNPLASIKMYSEIMQGNDFSDKEKAGKYLKIIEGESERLERLIDNVLNIAAIEKGIKSYNFTNVDLNGIVREVLSIMEYQLKINKFKICTHIEESEYIIHGDKDSLTDALTNIISNSIKYSKHKKEIIISTKKYHGFSEVSIQDFGKGIAPGNLEKIFIPYYREDETSHTKGTGIGLAIVKHIMDAHHGIIEVESEPDNGSLFKLKFPDINKNQ